MATPKYEAIRSFRLVDPRTGKGTQYVPGDAFDGPVDENPHLLGDDGPDGGGPLIADKQSLEKQRLEKSAPDESAADKTPSKEK